MQFLQNGKKIKHAKEKKLNIKKHAQSKCLIFFFF